MCSLRCLDRRSDQFSGDGTVSRQPDVRANLTTFLTLLAKGGKLNLNLEDILSGETLVTRGGEIMNARVRGFYQLPAPADRA